MSAVALRAGILSAAAVTDTMAHRIGEAGLAGPQPPGWDFDWDRVIHWQYDAAEEEWGLAI